MHQLIPLRIILGLIININDSHVIIVHLHELTLKGKNRSWFEKTLIKNLKIHLTKLSYSKIKEIAGRIIVYDIDLKLIDQYKNSLIALIGIRNFIIAKQVKLDIEILKAESLGILKNLNNLKSFRISSRRQNKNYQYYTF